MSMIINRAVPNLPTSLVEEALEVDVPTLGHFLETGFAAPEIHRIAGSGKLCGRAVTVRITATDSTLVHIATSLLSPGDVLVVDTGGDRIHAPVGGIVANAIAASGAVGVVIDGVCTDRPTLRDSGLMVYARGTSVLTTKLHGLNAGGINVPITCGGAPVQPGWLVFGDENGVILADPKQVAAVLQQARESDAAEPALVARLHKGENLPDLTPAGKLLAALGVEA